MWLFSLFGIGRYITSSDCLENGNIYSWGSNTYGQLGNNTTTDELKPILIFQNLKGVEMIFCGFDFSIFLQNGIIWSCGKNNLGQLGLGDSKISLKKIHKNSTQSQSQEIPHTRTSFNLVRKWRSIHFWI
jgi:alpha-tubulin suppressor-like RCC1 family protein